MADTNPESDADRITQLRERYVQAENAGDVEGILDTFGDDIVVMPPEAPPVRGIDAAREFLDEFLTAFDVEIELSREDIVVDGDLASEWGTVSGTLTPEGGQTQDVSNTYLLVYRREADGWRQSKHIWNANE